MVVPPFAAPVSAEDQLVHYYQGVDDYQRYSHERAHAGNQRYDLGLDAAVGAGRLAEGWVVRGRGEVDACEEAVFGEDGDGVDQEHGNV